MKTIHLQLAFTLSFILNLNLSQAQVVDQLNEAGYNDNSQSLNIRHLKGMSYIDLQYGYAKFTNFVNFGYGKLISDKTSFNVMLDYEYGKINSSTVKYENLMLGIGYSPFKIKNTLFITLTFGGLAGYVKSNNAELSSSESKFNTGLYGGLNIEAYLFNKLSLILKAEQQYNILDPFGNYHYHLGGGLRIYIY